MQSRADARAKRVCARVRVVVGRVCAGDGAGGGVCARVMVREAAEAGVGGEVRGWRC